MNKIISLKRLIKNSSWTPVTLFGVIVPWRKFLDDGKISDYKLVCKSGVEYFILADSEWRHTLAQSCWEEVTVKGVLNVFNMTIIPQAISPHGPPGERENVIEFAAGKKGTHAKKLKILSELILVPVAVLALAMA